MDIFHFGIIPFRKYIENSIWHIELEFALSDSSKGGQFLCHTQWNDGPAVRSMHKITKLISEFDTDMLICVGTKTGLIPSVKIFTPANVDFIFW